MSEEDIKNMRKLESLEKRVIYPDVSFYGAYTHDGQDIYLCNDEDEDYNDDGTEIIGKSKIECYIVNNVLTTNIMREYLGRFGTKVTEKITQTVELRENELLVYEQGLGFVIPEYKMVTIPEAMNLYRIIKGDEVDEPIGSEKENS